MIRIFVYLSVYLSNVLSLQHVQAAVPYAELSFCPRFPEPGPPAPRRPRPAPTGPGVRDAAGDEPSSGTGVRVDHGPPAARPHGRLTGTALRQAPPLPCYSSARCVR